MLVLNRVLKVIEVEIPRRWPIASGSDALKGTNRQTAVAFNVNFVRVRMGGPILTPFLNGFYYSISRKAYYYWNLLQRVEKEMRRPYNTCTVLNVFERVCFDDVMCVCKVLVLRTVRIQHVIWICVWKFYLFQRISWKFWKNKRYFLHTQTHINILHIITRFIYIVQTIIMFTIYVIYIFFSLVFETNAKCQYLKLVDEFIIIHTWIL